MLLNSSINYRCLVRLPHSTIRPASSSASAPAQILPAPSSSRHNDLITYLHHAQSSALSPTSTVHVGTSYEYLCAHALLRLGFTDLIRTGGRSDRGIDLLGLWAPPSLPQNSVTPEGLPVVIQCKAIARKPGPNIVRELEGTVFGAPGKWGNDATIGVLCAKNKATWGVREAVRRSRRGIVWVMVENLDRDNKDMKFHKGRGGRVKQILWNGQVAKMIGEELGAGLRYVPGEKGMEKEVCLTYDGRIWEPEVGGEVALA